MQCLTAAVATFVICQAVLYLVGAMTPLNAILPNRQRGSNKEAFARANKWTVVVMGVLCAVVIGVMILTRLWR